MCCRHDVDGFEVDNDDEIYSGDVQVVIIKLLVQDEFRLGLLAGA